MENAWKQNQSEIYSKQNQQGNWNPSSNWNQGQYYKKHKTYKKHNNYNQNQNQNSNNFANNQNSPNYINPNYLQNPQAIDPYTAESLIYRAEMYVLLRYPHLVDFNSKNADLLNTIDDKSQFFVIKSFSEEDVHKSIKYSIWTSTKSGNYTLNNAFRITSQNGGYVYLFYSTNCSGRFVGLARMKSEVNFADSFAYWTQDDKWTGVFQVEWLFIKDTPFKLFKNISIMMKDGHSKPVCNSRDTQEIPLEDACKMIEIIQNYKNTNTILEHFEYYDVRQENYEKHLNSNQISKI